jgi:NADPH:quinone reductase-like Zn-dependent oxidoreductase
MRAVEYRRYGAPDVLTVVDVPRPAPRPDEVLIRVRATTATAADGLMRRGETLEGRLVIGLFGPRKRFRIMGIEVAGDVEEVGSAVRRFAPGDRVLGFTGFRLGGYAEFCCLRETASLIAIPDGLTYEGAAALVDGVTTAIFFFDMAKLQRGERVLVIGASGSVGSAAVQVAAHRGAEVTAVCSGRNRDLVESLGAGDVLDYTREDYAQTGRTWDIIFDTVTKSSFGHARRALTDGGRYLPTVGGLGSFLRSAWSRRFGRKKFVFGMSVSKHAELEQLKQLVAEGAVRPVIDRRYPLEELALAHEYVDTGRKRGNVVILVDP